MNFFLKRSKLLLIILSLALFSCQKENTPSSALHQYVSNYINNKDTRESLLKSTTGPLQEKLLSLTDEQWKDFLVNERIKKKSLKVLLKSCVGEEKCYLTYSFAYKSPKDSPKKNYTVETKKIAELRKDDGLWKIANVSNVKTYIESSKNIDVYAK